MADVNKAHQLSAARKKLREYQKHRKPRTNENSSAGEDRRTPAESLTDSTHSSLNEVIPTNISPLQNYFNDSYANIKESANFFDDFAASKPAQPQELHTFNKVSYNENGDKKTETADVLTMEDPEINPNIIYDHLHRKDDDDCCKSESTGNMEALKQLSTQIIQLIDDSATSELTVQNRHEFNNGNQTAQNELKIQMLQERISQVQDENTRKLEYLEEQLRCHQQTVNILVTEKAELSTILTKTEVVAKTKTAECEELSARLKTSRSRVADLEKELNVLRTEKSKYDEKHNTEHANLLSEHKILKERHEEAVQDISELQEKLSANLAEKAQLQHEVQDLSAQLSLLNVKVQQLSTAENSEVSGRIDSLNQHSAGLEKQIVELHSTIKVLTNERDQASLQYQRYVQQLNNQTSILAQKLEAKTEENEALALRGQQLINQIGELEKVLQQLQNEHQPFSTGTESRKELEEAFKVIEDLRVDKVELEEKYNQVIGERDEVFRELETRKDDLAQLEELVQQLKQDQPDNTKLLASIESDKVAASRAVTQNAELKKQLEEMQEAFIKMSNDKLELTEKLTNEQHKSKDLREKLNQFESQIHTLTDAIEIKDREMVSLRESASELNKYILQQNQLEDRLRHYEAHDHSTHALQFELQESYKRIQNLKIENERLETRIENMEKQKAAENSRNVLEGVDRVALQKKIDQLEQINKEIELKLTESSNSNNNNTDDSILSKEMAMAHLEEKFSKTMQDIANLQDEKQRLEHLVLQLQSETETIGEYVALYQHQRGILKQRALEREEQMHQLALDREMMKCKLDRLNQLIKALLVENGGVNINTDLLGFCTEHAKLHEEINKVGVQNGSPETGRSQTAEKIIELLSEIKTSNLVQPFDTSESFHPCPWCSGQLITVLPSKIRPVHSREIVVFKAGCRVRFVSRDGIIIITFVIHYLYIKIYKF